MRMNNWIKYSLGLGLVALIGACSVATSMDATLEREVEVTTALKEKAKAPAKAAPEDVVRVKNEIWLGDKSMIEYDGAPIPAYLETKEGITLISNRPITLYEIGDMINKITSIQDYIDTETLQRYDAVDINVYEANLFHTKMMLKEIDLQNYLFNTDVYELPPRVRLDIMDNLRREMIEIFSGRSIY